MSRQQHVCLNAYAHTFPPDGRQVWVVNWQIQARRQSRTKGVIGSITFTSFNSFSDIENQRVFIGFSLPERQSKWTAAQDLLSRKAKNGVFQLKVDCLARQNWLSCSLTLTILQPNIDYLAAQHRLSCSLTLTILRFQKDITATTDCAISCNTTHYGKSEIWRTEMSAGCPARK